MSAVRLSTKCRTYLAAWPAGQKRSIGHKFPGEPSLSQLRCASDLGYLEELDTCWEYQRTDKPCPTPRVLAPRPVAGFPFSAAKHWTWLRAHHPPRVVARTARKLQGQRDEQEVYRTNPLQHLCEKQGNVEAVRRYLRGESTWLPDHLEILGQLGPIGRRLFELDLCVEPDPAAPGTYRALDPEQAWAEFMALVAACNALATPTTSTSPTPHG